MKVALAADHAGVELKAILARRLANRAEVLDLGTDSTDPVDYPDIALALALAVTGGRVERGILFCGSGVGASVAANKVRGIRAGLCHDTYSARQGVEHDDVNVLVLGARVIGPELAALVAETFLDARFSAEERHVIRLAKVRGLEARHFD
ncbi:MAG TPA: RpiB/LacA/LacB family sugar-phosphate isomerase [Methylomirabilota bacterium]|nr:RpiB/LacA/LacB family sugar-phosphate isomerase [Methylomirabilota bacterium]